MTKEKDRDKAKAERLAAALRENLKRRKAQARGRAQGETGVVASDEAKPDKTRASTEET